MPNPEKIIPIILAAGDSNSLPFPRALAPFGSKTALHIAIDNCSFLGRPAVVLGSDAETVAPAVPHSVQLIINRQWRDGQITSLRAALENLPTRAAFLIYPVDLPLLRQSTVAQLVHAFRLRSAPHEILMPRHKDAYGHPVLVSAAVRPEFFSAPTAREVIYRVPERIRVHNVRTSSIFEDFSTPESYEACLRKFKSRK